MKNFFKKLKKKLKKSKAEPERKYGFFGDYSSWEEVEAEATGDKEGKFLQEKLKSILKVKSGEIAFERDGAVFDKISYSYPLLIALLKSALENNNVLNVTDFGGSLGTHYFQNKEILKPVKIQSWNVVELEDFVQVGNEKVADGILQFHHSIDTVHNSPLLILSGVLQYLKNPYEWIERFISKEYIYRL